MIRVVIDTNVVVSANLSDKGLSAAILDLAANKKIQMFVSEAILAEYEEVLHRPRLKLSLARINASMAVIRNTSELVAPIRSIEISDDPPDNRFLECADAANADYIVTGNTVDFPTSFENTKIVTPKQFVDMILPPLTKD